MNKEHIMFRAAKVDRIESLSGLIQKARSFKHKFKLFLSLQDGQLHRSKFSSQDSLSKYTNKFVLQIILAQCVCARCIEI